MWTILFLSGILFAPARTAQPATGRYVGAVVRADPASRVLLLRLDGGGEQWIAVPPELEILRIAPGEKDIGKASKLPLEDVRPGDRVLARSDSQAGGVPMVSQLLVVSQAEVVRRQTAEREDWKARGVTGKVTAVDPDKGEITILTRPRPVAKTITIQVSARTEQRRYRPDSARYSDAVPAVLGSLKPGDQVQALGERTPDGRMLLAEKLVSGAFRNFAARILNLDAANQQMTVEPAGGGPPLVVRIGPSATLRRLRPEDAAALASRKPAKAGEARNPGADPQTILDSSPVIALGDLKPGDAVIIATGGNGGDAGPLPAIAVIAGTESLLKRSGEAQRELLGSWDLSLDPEEPGGRGGE